MPIDQEKKELIQLLDEAGVFKFGSFITKSGRESPFFLNFGSFCSGNNLARLGNLLALQIKKVYPEEKKFYLFGAAYKGIPLAVATAMALTQKYGVSAFFTFNRKELKKHGEGGNLVGHIYQSGDKIIMIDDVLTGGTSARESLEILKPYNVLIQDLVVIVDREEKGLGQNLASQELVRDFQLQFRPLLTIHELVNDIWEDPILRQKYLTQEIMDKIATYWSKYS